MDNKRKIAILGLCGSLFALAVIGLGAFTRLVDAGLGCPDWPGCYGFLTVPGAEKALMPLDIYKAWAEMIHRYFAGMLSLLILPMVFFIFTKERNGTNISLAIGLLLLIVYQVLLGLWTVTLKLLPIVVTQHLLGGFLILSLLWLIYLNNREQIPLVVDKKPSTIPFFIALILLFIQIFLGAWTSTQYASLSCPDFPFCFNDNPWQTMHWKLAFNFFTPLGINYEGGVLSDTVRQTIQMIHRLGALMVTFYMLILTAIMVPRLKNAVRLIHSFYLIWGLLCIQICIGITNVIFQLPLITGILHNLIAVGLLLSMITLIYNLRGCHARLS